MKSPPKRRLGDRPDGRRLRSLDPLFCVAPYIMKHKSGSSNFFSGSINITQAEKYIREKRRENMPGLGMLHFFIATYIRTVSQMPAINRFISGQKIYARYDIEVNLTVKKELTVAGQETVVKVRFEPTDTIYDVYKKVQAVVAEAKKKGDSNGFDRAARMLKLVPGLVLKFVVFILELMDYFGVLPRALLNVSPFHGSIFISDLGSVGLPSVNHHLYDFGNIPLFLCFGVKSRKSSNKTKDDPARFIDFTLTIDERICDGFYFSGVLRLVQKIFNNPNMLDHPPETVVPDVD
ncbi:MAG: hypothetical protein PHX02_06770 [Oscillospiraceae bacterium]|jgi:hypothetical protein|nr:hypothetical protein [Oscillospiraceae bacterium]